MFSQQKKAGLIPDCSGVCLSRLLPEKNHNYVSFVPFYLSIVTKWDEQIQVLEEYVIGKTAEEVAGIAVDDATKPTDVDLVAGVTIKIGDYKKAIVEAAQNAEALGTQEGDKLGLGIITNMNKSKDADGDKEGQCQAYSTYVAVTTDGSGKITAAIIDCTQGTVKFDTAGKITSDLKSGVKTKRQLGDDYGMRSASGIGKEWFEQAASMEDYLVGRTARFCQSFFKGKSSIALPCMFLIMETFGFQIGGGIQPKSACLAIRFIYVIAPILLFGITIILTHKYPLTRDRFEQISAKLEKRRVFCTTDFLHRRQDSFYSKI